MREPCAQSVEALRRLALDRRVYYDVVPDLVFQDDRFQQVGFVLTLWASHERGARALPGCEKCRAIFGDLRQLATWAVRDEGGCDAVWEIEPFEAALHSPAVTSPTTRSTWHLASSSATVMGRHARPLATAACGACASS